MAKRNYLIEGVSASGKSSVCKELKNRGYQAIDGDKELAYQGDPDTGEKVEGFKHENHIWNVDKVKELVNDKTTDVAFFCGGSRNFDKFIELFDEVFILDIDDKTIIKRINDSHDNRWGKKKQELELILRLNSTKEDIPQNATLIDAALPLADVVAEIVNKTK